MSCRVLLKAFTLFLLPLAFPCDCSFAGPLPLDEYRAFIREGLSLVEQGTGRLSAEESSFFDRHFPNRLEVNTRSGNPVLVDNGRLLGLRKQAQESDKGRVALARHLDALSNQISFVEQSIPLSEDRWSESRSRLDEVFRGREFQDLEEAKDPAWLVFLMDLMKRIAEWMERQSGATGGSGEWVEYVFYGVILAGVLFLILWILRSFSPVGWRLRDLKIKSAQGGRAPGMDWLSLREESRHKGDKGEYREAIRLFFISVLMEGHERGWWIYRREATNREHLIGADLSSERREALGKMIQVYEKAWYGHEAPTEQAFLQCAEWLRLIRAG
ncbi:MAG: DUF4129 domain-containing protein [Deltaproteobacteria bacterium]